MDWTDLDIKAWIWTLSRIKGEQTAIIADMLKHAKWDSMSAEDREVCVRALTLLNTGEWHHAM